MLFQILKGTRLKVELQTAGRVTIVTKAHIGRCRCDINSAYFARASAAFNEPTSLNECQRPETKDTAIKIVWNGTHQ